MDIFLLGLVAAGGYLVWQLYGLQAKTKKILTDNWDNITRDHKEWTKNEIQEALEKHNEQIVDVVQQAIRDVAGDKGK